MSITQRLNNNNNDSNNINDTTTNKKNKQMSKNQHNNGRGEFIKTSGPAIQRFLISNFRRVLNLLCILLGISPASDAGEIPKRIHNISKDCHLL